jgi:hypothetical protein
MQIRGSAPRSGASQPPASSKGAKASDPAPPENEQKLPADRWTPPPPFTAEQLAHNAEPQNEMPPAFQAFVNAHNLGTEHSKWHGTRGLVFAIQGVAQLTVNPAIPQDLLRQRVVLSWNALRAAGLGVPSRKARTSASSALDPRVAAFVRAMGELVKSSNTVGSERDLADVWTSIQEHNWAVPARQEGDPGNGLDFLLMHHAMIVGMRRQFKDEATSRILSGWSVLPPPVSVGYMDGSRGAGMQKAVAALNRLTVIQSPAELARLAADSGIAFDKMSVDDFGAWLQSILKGPTSGIHSWMHAQYELPGSPVEMASFQKNLNNKNFWGLHGFIDDVFLKFLRLKGQKLDDYASILGEQDAEMDMAPDMPGMAMSEMPMAPKSADGSIVHRSDGAVIPQTLPESILRTFQGLTR